MHSRRRLLAALAILAGCGSPPAAMPDGGSDLPLEVAVKQGMLRGTREDATRIFLGIPFAAPPVGENRFRAPQPPAAWTGTRMADAYGPACTQFQAVGDNVEPKSSEDCLTLNVWTPARGPAKQPVMVWIHGGGYVLGSGSDSTYDGKLLSEAGNVVVVTINYRLGALGFLAHPAFSGEDPKKPGSGNWGLLDQQAALRWVKDNIAAFGGDPDFVTIFGESAGGMSVCAQLVSPSAAGLFRQAIIESGPCVVFQPPDLATWEKQGQALAAALKCDTGDAAAQRTCLRAKPAAEVLKALPRRLEIIFGDGVAWTPNVDGSVLPDTPLSLLKAGKVNTASLIVGANKDEGTLFIALGAKVDTEADLRAALQSLYPPMLAESILARYYTGKNVTPKDASIAAIGDAFVCDSRRVARLVSAHAPTFRYYFTHATQFIYKDLGAFHSAEIPFVFGNPYVYIPLHEVEVPLSHAMQNYWTFFARSTAPTFEFLGTVPEGAVAWPAYKPDTDTHLELEVGAIKTGTGLRKEACDFWDALVP